MKGKIHEHQNAGKGGFSHRPDNINRNGRPLSFKAKYKEIYENEDGVIWVDESVTVTREKDGKKQIGLPLTKSETILAKLDRLIMSAKNERTSLDAIKFIWEQIDGKPDQKIETRDTTEKPPIFGNDSL